MENKTITLLTTAHNPLVMTSVNVTKKKKMVLKKKCFVQKLSLYIAMSWKRLIDLIKEEERYQIGRRSIKWWHHIFYFLFDIAIINSFIQWQVKKTNRNLDELPFRITLAHQLIDGYSSRKRKGLLASFRVKKCLVPYDMCLASVRNHMPKIVSNER